MKIAFTSDEKNGLESTMSYHFGHCPYFIIVEINEDKSITKVESMENPLAQEHAAGELPNLMKELGINLIATGGMGPKAQEFFASFGIKPVIGVYGKVKDVLEEMLGTKIDYSNMEKPIESIEHKHEEISDIEDEVRRLKMDVKELRKEIAEIKSILKNR
jgi:predicted Fe-Mo cluster-binding NifX family protein